MPTFLRQLLSFLLAGLILAAGIPCPAFASDSAIEEASLLPIPQFPDESAAPENSEDLTKPEETLPATKPENPVEATEPEEPAPATEPEPSAPDPDSSGSEPAPSLPETAPDESDAPEPELPEPPVPTEPEPPQAQPMLMAAPEESIRGPGIFFGLLHAHSGISEGEDSVDTVFQKAAAMDNLDFIAVTDHSHAFDNADSGSIGTDGNAVSLDWAAGKAAAAAVTGPDFLGLYGYEMSWPSRMKLGHISSFGTPGFQSWKQEPYTSGNALEAYYGALSTVPGGVSQFNHPGTYYGTFSDFQYSAAADRRIQLIELDFSTQNPCRYYIEALDKGWHLAPTGSGAAGESVMTAVYAQSLTEPDLLAALGSRRVYATEDSDLEIRYSLGEFHAGSLTELRHLGETLDFSVSLHDPTDGAAGTAEIITTGGVSLAQQSLADSSGTLTFSLPAAPGYYFLTVDQADGDRAVTAPIWVDGDEDLGISGLQCETSVPVQKEPLTLTLELYNQESSALLVDALDILADGVPVYSDNTLTKIPAGSSLSHMMTLSCDCIGVTDLTAKLTGTLDGCSRVYETSLTLLFHQSGQVTGILADSGHGNAGLNTLSTLERLAAEKNIRLTAGTVTSEALKNCRFLLVTPPAQPFSEEFLAAATEFAQYGGSLVLCGQADTQDAGIPSARELNRLLEAIGSGMRFGDDLLQDPVNHGSSPSSLTADEFNSGSAWCTGLSADQVFQLENGCSVIPGSGSWLVKGRNTTLAVDGDGDGLGGSTEPQVVLMAWEPLSGGGTAVAAGSLFLDDAGLREPASLRNPGYANRTVANALLGIGGDPIPLSTIRETRNGSENALFRIRGYVTAGTSNPHNTFPDTLYLQDDTGGIAITHFRQEGIQTGTAMEVTGYLQTVGGNKVLKLNDQLILNIPMYFTQPKNGPWDALLNPGEHGGTLVEVTGTCLEIYCRDDGTLAGCLLEDEEGNRAKVQIDDGIFAGSDGENPLHETIRKDRTVWAMGLLHINEQGESVIRVRNCEEVTWVPPGKYLNPRTGDPVLIAFECLALSALGLLFLRKRK